MLVLMLTAGAAIGAQDVADSDGPRDIRAELMDEAFEDGELARGTTTSQPDPRLRALNDAIGRVTPDLGADAIIEEALIAPMFRIAFTVAGVGYVVGYALADLTAPIVVRGVGSAVMLGLLGVHVWRLYRVLGEVLPD
jgi:hypothetical protein